ncbi:MAG: hypothetical protein MK116_09570 [Phycisphaerales bacterium]|nr:hypothetical protein [Phycisphaerales bacterium]
MIRPFAVLGLLAPLVLPVSSLHADSTADRYIRAAEVLDEELEDALETHAEVLRVSLRPPEQTLALIAKLDPAIKLINRAARARTCDWGIDMSAGLETEMPNISYITDCQNIVIHDLRRQIHEADLPAIGDRLIALYQMSRHVGPDCILRCLIQGRVINKANMVLDDAIDRGMMDAVQAERVLQTIRSSLDERDPLQVRASLVAEAQFTVAALEDTLVKWEGLEIEELEKSWLRDAAAREGFEPEDVKWLIKGRDALIEGLNTYWDDLLAIMDEVHTEPGKRRLDAMEQRVVAGEYGPLTRMLAVNMYGYFSYARKAREDLKERKTLLQQIADGTLDPMSRANAAGWYARACLTAEIAGPDWWEDEAARTQVLAELAMAARADRCTFPAPEDYAQIIGEDYALQWTEPVITWWLAPMDEFLATRLAAADASDVAGNREAAINHLLASAIMIRHLADNPTLASSIVAASRCRELMDRVEAMHAVGLSAPHREALLDVMKQIPMADAFGLGRAAERTKRRLSHHLTELKAHGLLPAYRVPSDPDDLLYLMAWVQRLPRSTPYYDYIWSEDFHWPDAAAGTSVAIIDDTAMTAATQDGVQALEAWAVDVLLPLEPSHDMTSQPISTLTRDAANRLRALCRTLDESLQGESVSE